MPDDMPGCKATVWLDGKPVPVSGFRIVDLSRIGCPALAEMRFLIGEVDGIAGVVYDRIFGRCADDR
jgi:hypothetical protein